MKCLSSYRASLYSQGFRDRHYPPYFSRMVVSRFPQARGSDRELSPPLDSLFFFGLFVFRFLLLFFPPILAELERLIARCRFFTFAHSSTRETIFAMRGLICEDSLLSSLRSPALSLSPLVFFSCFWALITKTSQRNSCLATIQAEPGFWLVSPHRLPNLSFATLSPSVISRWQRLLLHFMVTPFHRPRLWT